MLSSLQAAIFTMKNNNNNIPNRSLVLPELLAPAGSFDCLKAAVSNGADAVYLGLKNGSARMGAENFTFEQLEEAVSYAHLYGVKIYLALNTLFSDYEISSAYEDAKKAANLGVDAIILQDLGLSQRILQNRQDFPCEIHASTQMSIFNPNGLHFLEDMGFDRCITARELSIDEIHELCHSSNMEIEVFCHGALCMSVSGQCLLSSFIGGRSGNRGTCAQPCRMKYALQKKNHSAKEPAYRLSPADFASLPYLRELVEAGVHSLKIEGRLKSPEYVAQVTRSYRQALDSILYEMSSENNSLATEKNIYKMQLLFGRGAFSSGYLKGKLPFSDITFHTSGRMGVNIGIVKDMPLKLPSPKSLPKNLTRFKIRAAIDNNFSLRPGDGITVYNEKNEYEIVCGGTVNSISEIEKPALQKNSLQAKKEFEIVIVGKIHIKHTTDAGNFTKNNYILSITDDSALRKELSQDSGASNKKIPVNISFIGKAGSTSLLNLSDNSGNQITILGDNIISKALKAPTSEADIVKQLKKLGDTPYIAKDIAVTIDENVFLPVSDINNLRRKAVSSLSEVRAKSRANIAAKKQNITPLNTMKSNAKASFFFYKAESFLTFDSKSIPEALKSYKNDEYIYYLPINEFYKAKRDNEKFSRICSKIDESKKSTNCSIVAYFNFLSLGASYSNAAKELPFILENYFGKYIDGFMLENPGDYYCLKSAIDSCSKPLTKNPIICCDYSFNVANQASIELLGKFGISSCTLSPEDIFDVSLENNNVTPEIIVGGKIILMRSRHCYIDEGECQCKKAKCLTGEFSLIDSHNCIFPILPQREDCCSILLSHKDLEISKLDIKKIRTRCPNATLRINVY